MKSRSSFVKASQLISRWQNLNALKARQLKIHHIDQSSFTNIYKLYKNVGFKYPFSSWRTLSCFIHKSMGIIFSVGNTIDLSTFAFIFEFIGTGFSFFSSWKYSRLHEFCVKLVNIFLFHRRVRKTFLFCLKA